MWRKYFGFLIIISLLILNCLEYNERITINEDGSGTIRISYSGPSNSQINDNGNKYIFLKGDKFDIEENVRMNYTSRNVKMVDFFYQKDGFNKYVYFTIKFENINDLLDVDNFRRNRVYFTKDKDGNYYFEKILDINGDSDFFHYENAFEKFVKDAVKDNALDKIEFNFECRLPYEIRVSNSDYIRSGNVAKWRFTMGDVIDKNEVVMWCKLK